jgi:cytochrome c556
MQWMARTCGAAAVAAAMLAGCSTEGAQTASRKVAISPEQIVAARQAAFRLSNSNFQVMRAAAEKGADVKTFVNPARSLAQWAAVLPTMFPPGTGPGTANTRARADIWSNRADFEQKARDYAAAASRLADLAQAGDMPAAAKQWDATWKTCGACHDHYRSEVPSSK